MCSWMARSCRTSCTAAKFEEAESGWYYSQRLKSVQVKYPNPKKDHEIMVSFEQFDLIGM